MHLQLPCFQLVRIHRLLSEADAVRRIRSVRLPGPPQLLLQHFHRSSVADDLPSV
jgi:hypothetical protein